MGDHDDDEPVAILLHSIDFQLLRVERSADRFAIGAKPINQGALSHPPPIWPVTNRDAPARPGQARCRASRAGASRLPARRPAVDPSPCALTRFGTTNRRGARRRSGPVRGRGFSLAWQVRPLGPDRMRGKGRRSSCRSAGLGVSRPSSARR